MLFRTHILFGLAAFMLASNFITANYLFLSLVLLGSILPDIDEKHSKMNQWVGIFGNLTVFLTKHRGIIHSLPFNFLLLSTISFFFGTYYAIALSVGYVSHLLADGLTPMGVHLFYPFSNFRINGPVRTGSFAENIISLILFIVITIQLF